MSEQASDANGNVAANLYKDFKTETEKRQISSSENLDKSILTYSSWMFGISVAFLKDFIPIDIANAAFCLYASWIFFAFSISSTTASFLISYKALDVALEYANKYYLQGDEEYFNKKNPWNKWVRYINLSSGVSFVLGIAFTTIFVSCNLEKSAMEKKMKIAHDGMPASLMTKVPADTGSLEKKGLPSPSMQKLPPVPPSPPPVQGPLPGAPAGADPTVTTGS
jgi:hypothetical protein